MTQVCWTPVEIKILKELWVEGMSARVIANAVGKTRNAVIGKAHRLIDTGILRKRPPRPHHPVQKRAPAKAVAPAPVDAPIPHMPNNRYITCADLEPGMCRWPINEGDPQFHYCGNATDKTYCAFHSAARVRKTDLVK